MDQRIHRQTATLAIVDPDEALRQALTFSFETAGIGVQAFSTGGGALDAETKTTWGCLVTDYRLPDITGLDLLDRFRQAGVILPWILTITNPTRAVSDRALAAGVEVFEKPLLNERLLQRVRTYLFSSTSDLVGCRN